MDDKMDTNRPVAPLIMSQMDRRRFIKGAAALGGAAIAGGLLAACGEDEAEVTTTAPPATTVAPAPTPHFPFPGDQLYVWVTANLADPFYNDGIAGMEEFGRLFGVETQVVGPQDLNVGEMVIAFETVLEQPNIAGICSYLYEWDALRDIAVDAMDSGIPIVHANTDWGTPRSAFVGGTAESWPSVAADTAASILGGSGKVGYIAVTSDAMVPRRDFFAQFLTERHPGIEYVGPGGHDGTADDAIAQTEAYIAANPGLDLMVFGDGQGPSLVDGLVSIYDGHWILSGFGPGGLRGVQEGKVAALIDRSTHDEEFYAFQACYWLWNGYRVPDSFIQTQVVLDSSNVDAFVENPYSQIQYGPR